MRLLLSLFLLPTLLIPAFCQSDRVDLISNRPGRAEAKVAGITLRADEATLNRETGELKMRGHVHVILPAREDHTVVRYGKGVLLTKQAIGLSADQVTVKSGLLEASGNLVLVPVDPDLTKVQLRSDGMYMYLKIGDATLRGNIRPSGITERHGRGVDFPPDIIK
ncbi:MAG TPA: hypothetical protein VHW09_24360 [Bryobacteraceae bacterium]|nr:hypothetical protein [Bryobacteraceae bacterium]